MNENSWLNEAVLDFVIHSCFWKFLNFLTYAHGSDIVAKSNASLAIILDPNMIAIPKHGYQTKALGSNVFIRPKAFGSGMVDRPKTRVLNGFQPMMLLAWLQQPSQTQDAKVAEKKQWMKRKKKPKKRLWKWNYYYNPQ